jgi:hypothetical protein
LKTGGSATHLSATDAWVGLLPVMWGQRVTSSGVYEANNARERLEEVSIAVTKNYFLSEIPQYPYKAE